MGLWVLWVLWVWGSLGVAMGLTLPHCGPPGAGVVGVLLRGLVGACGCRGCCGSGALWACGLYRGCYGLLWG